MYPLYMFAMFSKQEQPREVYFTYSLYSNNEKVNPKQIDFRKYTVLMNTIGQYDDIISNEMIHPESGAIDKFITRLHLDNSQIKNELKHNFIFDKTELNSHLGPWIMEYLDLPQEEIRIERESYSWRNKTPQIFNTIIIYELDQ